MKSLGATVAGDAALASRVVVAKVDADLHRELGSRFGVSGFPTIKVFRRGRPVASGTDAEDYQGPRSMEAILAHLKTRLAEDKAFARVASLDELAKSFVSSSSSSSKEVLVAKIEAAASKVTDEAEKLSAKLYAAYASKAASKGDGDSYFAKEHARLERVLGSGSVGGNRAAEISRKLSVLSAFLPEEETATA